MSDEIKSKLSKFLRRSAMAAAVGGIVAASAVRAAPSHSIVVVPPAELPELARQRGDAMLMHETADGRTLLYIEQNHGARLATLDVTDPLHIKAAGSVELNVTGPFDFVSALGSRAELIRFRQGQEDAVLDLHKADAPSLKMNRGATLQENVTSLGNVGIAVNSQVTKGDTGTTFMLKQDGLYMIRRPAVESLHQVMMITPN
jgi:hypothetical protein